MTKTNSNLVWHEASVSKQERHARHNHKGCVLWFTGLSGSGKSTLANALDRSLFDAGLSTYVLDGDNIRHGLNKDLGFSDRDRQENIRRIGEVAKLFVDAGTIVSTAFISPFQSDRDQARALLADGEFVEVYVKCPLEECERRDVKGLYKKARNGEIPQFTGISSPYEEPETPEITVDTSVQTVEESVEQIIGWLEKHHILTR
ncbi:adenylyl-sulfate kinase [Shouchella clausii]|jgi:adenylylsulfate kinase|uniref:Adenylyl-sulfate kinase n=3 Tax=Shouchella TaxID=2893057 RepID=Q5WKF2_SHOC1|nr:MULTISPECIES: adenylyl-sulfate kinase [Shouchella]MCM3314443.1 adenylyl-sulfate kinase [Psychrobacillus sp. MER TA 17]ALA52242.1 Adenylylsulfate kinase [Shouchella clausii]KKI86825.1 adenylylsulfate kinase [Shouchella clausii]MBU3230321.1 adenylyl-sulfate kinase [Shouchella clausii]MBU3262480.1 adenylyl-sulfate kinase [Shouchella clausii]